MNGGPQALAVTQGEPAGIGPELIGMAWQARAEARLPSFFCVGDVAFLERRLAEAGLAVPLREISRPSTAGAVFQEALPVLPARESIVSGIAGKPSPADAGGVIASITDAVELVRLGEAPGVVTPPIQKDNLYAAGFGFPGHTEFLGDLSSRFEGVAAPVRPVMMLACDELRAVPVTIHVPLRAVPELLTKALIVETAVIVARDLEARFGIADPRLAVAGLNPHAGEGGAIGREEIEIILPAIEELRGMGIRATGPHPGDTLFHPAARAEYDAVLTMYHDQGLIPVKTLAFDRGVNVTLGLPFVRTSPDHGTALSLAGKGTASPTSLIEALRLADRLTR
ncbi:4-hydroxythreonine-4-phosphate dehydrogenase PdxA [Lutibaculum baratangense]|uniref:4-hydroxythreonine-4-phosphate dehydrogenase n=1 Tax=Lutibaculum baratangense AMV1 TaxID=631454 RepID=V4TND3_9HYPH|nr:4-hydroxythreonine-4-phosphate dehydrogenase PdxA [Lutibaculum baratangense]ESR27228.1 4-hydroxythreonine-4-phosphate dehydrogenase [Lutibaculum baratangense AMV1]